MPVALTPTTFTLSNVVSKAKFTVKGAVTSLFVTLAVSSRAALKTRAPVGASTPFVTSTDMPITGLQFIVELVSFYTSFGYKSPSRVVPGQSRVMEFLAPDFGVYLPVTVPTRPTPLVARLASSVFLPMEHGTFGDTTPAAVTIPY